MSAPVQNNFLDSLFLEIGSSGSSTGLGSSLTSIGSLFGPMGVGIGAATGLVSNLIPGLDGFLKNGFDFTCIGSQAFNKANLDAELQTLSGYANAIKSGSDKNIGEFLDWLMRSFNESNLEIAKYSSGCSKSLRGQLRDAVKKIYDSVDKSNFDITTVTKSAWDGAQYQTAKHTLKTGSVSLDNSSIDISTVTEEHFKQVLVPQIEQYALTNGLDVSQAIEQAHSKIFGSGNGGINGGVTGGVNTNGEWWVDGSLGNRKDNTGMYILIGLGAVAVWFVTKK